MTENYFEQLNNVNVGDKTEKKNGLTYLSWAWAWAEVKKICSNATYEIKKFGEKNLPYIFDEETGYMVFTTVTIDDLTHEMWLPVMDGANKAMKNISYKYKTKYGEKECVKADMFDINKTIMRCLTKNLAMFGLGLYIYAGEDLPEADQPDGDKETLSNVKNTSTKKPDSKKPTVDGKEVKDILSKIDVIAKKLAKTNQDELKKVLKENNDGKVNYSGVTDVAKANKILLALENLNKAEVKTNE